MIYKVCGNCGSDEVCVDASAAWCVENQMWELADTYSHAWCNSEECDGNPTRDRTLIEDEGKWYYLNYDKKCGPYESRAEALADMTGKTVGNFL